MRRQDPRSPSLFQTTRISEVTTCGPDRRSAAVRRLDRYGAAAPGVDGDVAVRRHERRLAAVGGQPGERGPAAGPGAPRPRVPGRSLEPPAARGRDTRTGEPPPSRLATAVPAARGLGTRSHRRPHQERPSGDRGAPGPVPTRGCGRATSQPADRPRRSRTLLAATGSAER